MFYLLFDFETTGVGKDFMKQRAIQIAWLLIEKVGENYNEISKHSYLLKNNVTEINEDFHGENITMDMLKNDSTDEEYVFNLFLKDLDIIIQNKGNLVAHNIDFDYNILKRELTINGLENNVDWFKLNNLLFCTMKKGVKICKIEKEYNGNIIYKYPKLIELYTHYFGTKPNTSLHLADNDVNVMYECFKKMI
jgi:DNA polymerase III alpha subunit (gram-positive type)